MNIFTFGPVKQQQENLNAWNNSTTHFMSSIFKEKCTKPHKFNIQVSIHAVNKCPVYTNNILLNGTNITLDPEFYTNVNM